MQQRARLIDDELEVGESILAHALSVLPAWLPLAASQDVREYRRLLEVARRLKRARRCYRWSIDVNGMARDFGALRASVFKRTGR